MKHNFVHESGGAFIKLPPGSIRETTEIACAHNALLPVVIFLGNLYALKSNWTINNGFLEGSIAFPVVKVQKRTIQEVMNWRGCHFFIPEDLKVPVGCIHSKKHYIGLFEEYDYCEKCGEKL